MAEIDRKATDTDAGGPLLMAARGLYKGFRNGGAPIEILTDADFTLRAGETVAVVGASGIGKSTFLNLLGTLERPDKGRLLFEGQDMCRLGADALARLRNRSMGFVFQFHHLLPEFTAMENAMMPLLIQGRKKAAARKAAEEILVRVGLKDRLGHRVMKLSGGEQQRVALARALVTNPRVLLADEPTGNLDRANSQQVHALLLELNREFAMAMVVVTHNTELASFMRRQVTILDGKVISIR